MSQFIAREIKSRGPISFSRFMELALYCPVYGYYEKEKDKPGRTGDFYTSVSVGSLFGELLAFRFAEWLEADFPAGHGPEEGKSESAPVQILEAGAHDGQLARDILAWLRRNRPALFERTEYLIAEPSPVLARRQREELNEFARVRWVEDIGKAGQVRGIIFANELLDAMPVHRFAWDAGRGEWFEWGVTVQGESFEWARLEGSSRQFEEWPRELTRVLPDGFIFEECPRAREWWGTAGRSLEWGRLLAFDYGCVFEERLEKPKGTLRAYLNHRVSSDVLATPGEQDLTAHVDFTAIRKTGEAAGLSTEFFGLQEEFLVKLAAQMWRSAKDLGAWGPEERRQFQTLTHPEHLGRFRVLVQGRALSH